MNRGCVCAFLHILSDSATFRRDRGGVMVVRVLGPGEAFVGKQGVAYPLRVNTETAGARRICLTVLPMPPGARAKAHYHDGIETLAYLLEGDCAVYHGERLEHRAAMHAGECMYLPPGEPHAPANEGDAPCTWVVAHAAGDDQRGIVPLPDLDALLERRQAAGGGRQAAEGRNASFPHFPTAYRPPPAA